MFRQENQAYKYAQIKTDLSIRILNGELHPNDRIPSLNEITDTYNVSKITARRVLNDLVAEGLVYAIRGRGSFVSDTSSYPPGNRKAGMSQNLGVVMENASGEFMSDLIRGIDEETFKHGMHINLCLSNDSYEREAEILNRLLQQGVNKILLFMVINNQEEGLNKNLPLYLSLQEKGVQLLMIDCYIPLIPIPSIAWDNYGGMKKLVEHVYQLGCRNLAYVARVNNAITTAKRLIGFKDGLLEHGLSYQPHRVQRVPWTPGESYRFGARSLVAQLLQEDTGIDAILCSDEEIGSGVFDALSALSKVGSRRIKVGGFGNPQSKNLLCGVPYIALEQNTYELGRIASEIILTGEIAKGNGLDGNGVYHKVLPVSIRQLE